MNDETRKRWEILPKFEKESDVPELPGTDAETWRDFYVPKLVEAGAIPKDRLEDDVWYYGSYRNSSFGKWNAKTQKFDHWRYKFGWMADDCNHFEDDDGFALFVPLRKATAEEVDKITRECGVLTTK